MLRTGILHAQPKRYDFFLIASPDSFRFLHGNKSQKNLQELTVIGPVTIDDLDGTVAN